MWQIFLVQTFQKRKTVHLIINYSVLQLYSTFVLSKILLKIKSFLERIEPISSYPREKKALSRNVVLVDSRLRYEAKFDQLCSPSEGIIRLVTFIKLAGSAARSQIPRRSVEIERESNRRKLESFRAIKSDLIFNKFGRLGLPRRGWLVGWLVVPVRGSGPVGEKGLANTGGRRKKGRKARRKGNLLGNYKVTSSGDARSCEYSNVITSMIA